MFTLQGRENLNFKITTLLKFELDLKLELTYEIEFAFGFGKYTKLACFFLKWPRKLWQFLKWRNKKETKRSFYCVKNWLDSSKNIVFCKNIGLGEQFLVLTFVDNFNFWTHLFCKNGPSFWPFSIPPFQKTPNFPFNLVSYYRKKNCQVLNNRSHANVNAKRNCPSYVFKFEFKRGGFLYLPNYMFSLCSRQKFFKYCQCAMVQ